MENHPKMETGPPHDSKSAYHENCKVEDIVVNRKRSTTTSGPNEADDEASRVAALDEHIKRYSFGKNPHRRRF